MAFHVADHHLVSIHRDAATSDAAWTALYNVVSPFVHRELPDLMIVSLEGFLSRLSALADTAGQLSVQITIVGALHELVDQLGQDIRRRYSVLSGSTPQLTPSMITEILRGTRFCRELRVFQKRDLCRLYQLPHGANFSVPGAGKTTVAYALYELLRTQGQVERLLVVAPLSAFGAWKEEATECFNPALSIEAYSGGQPPDVEVLLVNYHRLANRYDELARWVAQRPTHVILDEAHRIKRGRGGLHGTVVLDLAIHARRRDVLTGTPAPQAATDLVPLFEFLWPGQASQILPDELTLEERAGSTVQAIATRIAPLYVRTNKKELKLPKTVFDVQSVEMGPLQKAIYDALLGEFLGQLKLSSTGRQHLRELGRIVMYLIEAASNPVLLAAGSSEDDLPAFQHPPLAIQPGSDLWELFLRYGSHEIPAKLQTCIELARKTATNGKVLIWTTFRRNIAMVEKLLVDLQPAVIHGGVPMQDDAPPNANRFREAEIKRFHDDPQCRVMIANPAACAEGVSLHNACHHAIFLDRTFNAGQFLQAQDRIHRLGLRPKQETTFTILMSKGTIDETINIRVAEKVQRLQALLGESQLSQLYLPTEEDSTDLFDEQDAGAVLEHIYGDQ